ncbi:hypothetical protein Barb7_02702 [Bacteroidales bacterium Barb7]|nr:hypothetical protein Barb7_02702 [Bacteroidales bacterium Barb7]
MFAHIKSLIGSIYNDCIFHQAFFFQIVNQTTHLIINRFDATQVIFKIPLIFPFYQLLPFQVLGNKLFVLFRIPLIPCGTLCRSQTTQYRLDIICQFGNFQIDSQVHFIRNSHLLRPGSRATGTVIIIKGFRIGKFHIFI